VERYPLLQSSIAACQASIWICDASTAATTPAPGGAALRWDRSHGED